MGTSLVRSFSGVQLVMRQPHALMITLGVTLVVILGFSLVPHIALLKTIFASGAPFSDKIDVLLSLAVQLGPNAALPSKVVMVINSFLLGILVAMLRFYIVHRRRNTKTGRVAGAVGVMGMTAALFGIGCAACGSVIVVSVLGLIGGTGLLALLPFHGLEFGLLGLALLASAILYLAAQIQNPLVCRID